MQTAKIWGCVVALSLIPGCVSFDYRYADDQERRLISRVIGEPAEEPAISPLYLSQEVQDELDSRINKRWGDRNKLNRLRSYLFDEDELNLQYQGEVTKTAMGLWESRIGNCLSMANLFIATARYVGLDASYTTVEIQPTWDQQGSTLVRYEHIIASGKLNGGDRYVVDFLPDFVIGDRHAVRIDDNHALALFYNNLGAEAVIEGDYKSAIVNLQRALAIDADYSDAWNNIGAAFRRDGQLDLAEFAYQRAVHLDENNYSALSNLAQFYQYAGREPEAEHFIDRVNRYRQRNPYFHYFVARFFYERGDYEDAIVLLERSIHLKRDEPDFYEALAKTYDQMGDTARSERYTALADKYREQVMEPAPRMHNHRFWVLSIDVN